MDQLSSEYGHAHPPSALTRWGYLRGAGQTVVATPLPTLQLRQRAKPRGFRKPELRRRLPTGKQAHQHRTGRGASARVRRLRKR